MSSSTPPSFVSRIALAIGSFFAILGDGPLAARVQRLRAGEQLAADVPPREVRVEVPVEKIVEVRVEVPVEKIVEKRVEVRADDGLAALQLLGLLQRQARFVDFVQEDVAQYSDAEIGAAARVVHEGCRKVLREHVSLTPVRAENEGSRLTLPEGFDAAAVRVTGNVVGKAPFTGTLSHRGWRATDTRLPRLAAGHDAAIVAQAEVEL